MNLRPLLYCSIIFVILSCSSKSTVQILSQEEKASIDSLGLDSALVLDVKRVAKVDFKKMPGAVQELLAIKKGKIIYPIHGVQVGYFDVAMNFDETLLKSVREKWRNKCLLYTVKDSGINRLMINL
jgi:hypothetical protein